MLKLRRREKKVKGKLNNGLAFLMTLILLANALAILPILPVAADPAFELYMDPSDNDFDTDTHFVGYEWDIVLWVKDIPALPPTANGSWAFQVKMWFNTAWLSCAGASLATGDTSYIYYGKSTVAPPVAIDNTLGNVLVGDSLMGEEWTTQGAGPFKLGTVRMRIEDTPDKYGTLNSALGINNVDTYVDDYDGVTIPGMTKTDGTADFVWLPPKFNPNLAIRPAAKTFDQYGNHTHPPAQATVEVKIENLAAAWALHNASATVIYNTPENILLLDSATLDPAWQGPGNTLGLVPGTINIYVANHTAPSGDIVMATLVFNVTYQGVNPPQSDANVSNIEFTAYTLWDTFGTIPTNPEVNGTIKVDPFLSIPLPFFTVEPEHTVLGPELVVGDQYGKTFEVNVTIKNLHGAWHMIAWQLRLSYDPTLLNVVSVTEGGFLKDSCANKFGTFFIPPSLDPQLPWEGASPPHTPNIVMGCMLYPNGMGVWDSFPGLCNPELIVENLTAIEPPHMTYCQDWHEVSPDTCTMHHEEDYIDSDHDGLYSYCDYIKLSGHWYHIIGVDRPSGTHVILHLKQEPDIVEGVLATIVFEPIRQSWTVDYMCDLEVFPLYVDSYLIGYDPIKDELTDIPVDEGKNEKGDVTVLHISAVGRRIDVWICDYPFPYGGQGLGEDADLVLPQQLVCLCVKVTYNWWPVEGKLVSFEIRDNNDDFYGILTAVTGADGHAMVCFRMPWPGEDLIGVWTIIACVEVAEVVVCDTMQFHYDYLVHTWKITTDKPEYAHLETVTVTVEFGSHAQQAYITYMDVLIKDELKVIVDNVMVKLAVGGASFCEYKNYTATVTLIIPHWAYAGMATVHVNFFLGAAVAAIEAIKTIWIMPI